MSSTVCWAAPPVPRATACRRGNDRRWTKASSTRTRALGMLLLLLACSALSRTAFVVPRPTATNVSTQWNRVSHRRPELQLSPAVGKNPGESNGSTQWSSTMAVRDAIYAAVFGAPDPEPGDAVGMSELEKHCRGSVVQSLSGYARRMWDATRIPSALAGVSSWWEGTEDTSAQEFLEKALEENGKEAWLGSASEGTGALVVADSVTDMPRLPSVFRDPSSDNDDEAEFFLFIKDYSWSLRYRVSRKDDGLNTDKPLHMEWVKLRKPLSSPEEILNTDTDELFVWEVKEPPRHAGFTYQVTETLSSGVEAVINFFKGHGMNFLVQTDGIRLVSGGDTSKSKGDQLAAIPTEPKPVTHCWVQVVGLPFFPVLQQIAFFDAQSVVMDWSA